MREFFRSGQSGQSAQVSQGRQALPGKRLWLGALIALVAATLVLATYAHRFEPDRLHLGGRYVDQAGYVTTAQVWLDTGVLESGLTYPAYLREPGWRLYMPGHYVALALSFELFGHGVWASLAPNLIAFALACAFVAGLALRRYGLRAAVFAVLLFAFFPLQQQYAFTAMAELTSSTAALAMT